MKTCTCCKKTHSHEEWLKLPFVGSMLTGDETGTYSLEMRNCSCGSTLGIETKCEEP